MTLIWTLTALQLYWSQRDYIFLCNLPLFNVFQLTCTQQIEEEFKEANMNLQSATEYIGNLHLQLTILTSGNSLLWLFNFFTFQTVSKSVLYQPVKLLTCLFS